VIDKPNRPWVIAVSFLFAFVLTAIPLPEWAVAGRPVWIGMVLIYWCIALPTRVGVLTGWCLGLVLDVLHGSILGQHALGLAFLAWMAVQYHQRLRVFPLVQQAVFVGAVVLIYLALMLGIYNLLGSVKYGISYLTGALTTALLWPWVFVVLRDVRRRARVA
jgi:rod shape-determining protein MreD